MPLALLVLFFLFGTVLGSFGNVVILRGSRGESFGGRSKCPKCKKTLEAIDLVPILSFLWLRGKCRRCKKPISWQYPLVEAASGVLFVLALSLSFPAVIAAVTLGVGLWLLLLIALIDLRTRTIPDFLSIPLIVFGTFHSLFHGAWPLAPVIAAVGFFGMQWVLSRGKWIGSGDIILAVGIACLLGRLDLFIVSVFLAYIIGALVAVILLLRRRVTLQHAVPFGPFLAGGAFLALVCGESILKVVIG